MMSSRESTSPGLEFPPGGGQTRTSGFASGLAARFPAGGQVRGQPGPVGGRAVRGHGTHLDPEAAGTETGQHGRCVDARQPRAELAEYRGGRHEHVGAERIGCAPQFQQIPGRDPLGQQRRAHVRVTGHDRVLVAPAWPPALPGSGWLTPVAGPPAAFAGASAARQRRRGWNQGAPGRTPRPPRPARVPPARVRPAPVRRARVRPAQVQHPYRAGTRPASPSPAGGAAAGCRGARRPVAVLESRQAAQAVGTAHQRGRGSRTGRSSRSRAARATDSGQDQAPARWARRPFPAGRGFRSCPRSRPRDGWLPPGTGHNPWRAASPGIPWPEDGRPAAARPGQLLVRRAIRGQAAISPARKRQNGTAGRRGGM